HAAALNTEVLDGGGVGDLAADHVVGTDGGGVDRDGTGGRATGNRADVALRVQESQRADEERRHLGAVHILTGVVVAVGLALDHADGGQAVDVGLVDRSVVVREGVVTLGEVFAGE